ncbi:hypothetical protein HYW74_02985 [Candidatus Pacearchaeota archaeon]|nr:hypothetical protein [Candidatus Pacearchaeota archaeon]
MERQKSLEDEIGVLTYKEAGYKKEFDRGYWTGFSQGSLSLLGLYALVQGGIELINDKYYLGSSLLFFGALTGLSLLLKHRKRRLD